MTDRSKAVAMILARGGSKAIPRKNLVELCGRPLIEYTLVRAHEAECISRVYVSTDDREIAEVARRFGSEVVLRPPELCTDTASSESGLLHCLDTITNAEGIEPDLVVFLQPTSPLRSASHIRRAVEELKENRADSLFSAGPLRGLAWKAERDHVVPVSYDPLNRLRRQDAPEFIAENGSIYVFKPWVLRKLKCRLGGKIIPFRMNPLDCFEIDEPEDIPVVEFLLRRRYPDLVGHRKVG